MSSTPEHPVLAEIVNEEELLNNLYSDTNVASTLRAFAFGLARSEEDPTPTSEADINTSLHTLAQALAPHVAIGKGLNTSLLRQAFGKVFDTMDSVAEEKLGPRQRPSILQSILAKVGCNKPVTEAHFARPDQIFWSDLEASYSSLVNGYHYTDGVTERSVASMHIATHLKKQIGYFTYIQQADRWA